MNVSAVKQKKDPYNFSPQFERALITLLCSRSRLWGRLGFAIDPECLALAPSKLAMQAGRMIAKELGHGADSTIVVIQRLRRWMSDGKVTLPDIEAVMQLFDDAEDAGLPDEEQVVNEVAPMLQRRAQREALEEGFGEFQRKGDPARVLQKLEKVQRIGLVDNSLGSLLGPATLEEMERLKLVQKLPTGILELDDALGGGTLRGTLNMWIGGSGGGKSMGLVQNAVCGAFHGFHVGYATLELPKHIIEARLLANLTGIAIDDILANPLKCGVKERLEGVQSTGRFGRIAVKEFTPKVTTIGEVKDWVAQAEDEWGQRMDVVVIDYADKMRAKGLSDRAQENSYQSSGSVYDDLYAWVRDTKRWGWTGSQSQRVKEKKTRKLDIEDVSDSMHKVRSADTVITMNLREDGAQMIFFIGKNRLGASNRSVGPLPTAFDVARVAPVDEPWVIAA